MFDLTCEKIFNKNVFDVVGNQTITDDGIANGFGRTAYSQQFISTRALIDTTNANSMQMECEFKVTKELQDGGQLFLLNYASNGINGKPNIQIYKKLIFSSDFNVSVDAKTNSIYKVVFDLVAEGMSYCKIYEDDILKIEKSKENYTDWKQNNPLFFYGYYSGENYNSIEINLQAISINVDGKEVVNGSKTVFDFDTGKNKILYLSTE